MVVMRAARSKSQNAKRSFCPKSGSPGLPHRTARTKSPQRSGAGVGACVPGRFAAGEPSLLSALDLADYQVGGMRRPFDNGCQLERLFRRDKHIAKAGSGLNVFGMA